MKRKKKIHTGVCITNERIVCVTAHVENKTMVITDALEMKRSAPIDEDVRKFIEMYDLDDGAYSIVAKIAFKWMRVDVNILDIIIICLW